jgi:hypothetical protein
MAAAFESKSNMTDDPGIKHDAEEPLFLVSGSLLLPAAHDIRIPPAS